MEGQKAELPSFYTYEVMVEQSRLLGVAAATLRERLLSTCGIHIDPAQAALRATEGHTLLLMDAMGSYLKLIAQDIRTYVASSTAATSSASDTPPGTSET
jgi:hypothetical protein